MFFALSGYLISGSIARTKHIYEFLTLRFVRIFPALVVEVLLSAFVLGLLFTTVPVSDYFQSPLFRLYLHNLWGDVHFLLPGVFDYNPTTWVNGSLWTIPYELQCYVAITLLWLVGAIRTRTWLLIIVIGYQVAIPLRNLLRGNFIKWDVQLPGRMLVMSFLYGVLIYAYRERIVLRWWMCVVAFIASLALVTSVYTSYLVALPAAYVTVYLGLTNPRKIPVLMDGDYSYGIYLYSSPIQQAVVALFPAYRVWWFNLAVSIVPFCRFAAFSWHIIEMPILQRRKAITGMVGRVVTAVGTMIGIVRRRGSGDATARRP